MGRSWWRRAVLAGGLIVLLGGIGGALLSGQPLLAALFGALMLAMLAIGAAAAWRGRRAARAPRRTTWIDAGLGSETVAAPPPSQAAGLESASGDAARVPWPAGFDAAAFLRAAKEKFIRLQVASVRGRLDELRDVITTDLYEHLRAGGAARHRRDVVTLQASLLEVATEAGRQRASVRFSGLVCAVPGAEAASFEQVWNLVKPVDGANDWLLSGVQQMH